MAELVRARRLTDQEGQRLTQIVRRGKHDSIRVRRAMVIMASASGTPVPTIARLSNPVGFSMTLPTPGDPDDLAPLARQIAEGISDGDSPRRSLRPVASPR